MKMESSSASTTKPEETQHIPVLQRGSSMDSIDDGNYSTSTSPTEVDEKFNINNNDLENDEELPNNVSRAEQLVSLPLVCLNQNPKTKNWIHGVRLFLKN